MKYSVEFTLGPVQHPPTQWTTTSLSSVGDGFALVWNDLRVTSSPYSRRGHRSSAGRWQSSKMLCKGKGFFSLLIKTYSDISCPCLFCSVHWAFVTTSYWSRWPHSSDPSGGSCAPITAREGNNNKKRKKQTWNLSLQRSISARATNSEAEPPAENGLSGDMWLFPRGAGDTVAEPRGRSRVMHGNRRFSLPETPRLGSFAGRECRQEGQKAAFWVRGMFLGSRLSGGWRRRCPARWRWQPRKGPAPGPRPPRAAAEEPRPSAPHSKHPPNPPHVPMNYV